jgi:hypothetical protein
MWSALRDLFTSVPPAHRLTLAIAVGCLLVGALALLAFLGLDLAPYWALLSGN